MSCLNIREPGRKVVNGVALDLAKEVGGTGVTLCFTERLGGISPRPYQSLNLGLRQATHRQTWPRTANVCLKRLTGLNWHPMCLCPSRYMVDRKSVV